MSDDLMTNNFETSMASLSIVITNTSDGMPLQQSNNSQEVGGNEIFDSSKRDIIIYSILFVISAAGNITVFTSLLRNPNRKLRINLLILNLAIADLIVTFIMIPLEVGWRITESWIAGDFACRLLQALRAFGPYLSSMVLVCISLDRYFAIVHPLKVNDANRRSKIMLTFSWMISIVCSVPQSIIYHVETHPEYPKFEQCVTFHFFVNAWQAAFYSIFCVTALYVVPLLIIIFCYTRILWEIYRRSKDSREDLKTRNEDSLSHNETSGYCPSSKSSRRQSIKYSNPNISKNRFHLRRSDLAQIERARTRTLRMTIIIVLAFVWCWTPYVFMVFFHQIDKEAADKVVDKSLQDTLYMFAVSNSCVNPLVYGSYTMNFRRFLRKYCSKCSTRELIRKGSSQVQVPASRRSTYLDENTTYSNVEASPPSPISFAVSIETNGSVTALIPSFNTNDHNSISK